MRKWLFMIAAIALMITSLFGRSAVHAAADWLDEADVERGLIRIQYEVKKDVKTKLLVVKGEQQYSYTLDPNKQTEAFPLQMGDGEYNVSVLENISGNTYRFVHQAKIAVQLEDSALVYLNSVQNVSWQTDGAAARKANELTKHLKNDQEKVWAIHAFVIGNTQYDEALASSVPADYLPDADRTLQSKKGICYDYASLMAVMLRSIGIPAKLMMGSSEYVDAYHAWNEVYVDDQWVVVDATVDAGLKANGTTFEMIKDAKLYDAVKQY